jgi:ADP-ribose pyrophosphatase YjhB (NUDIX family)
MEVKYTRWLRTYVGHQRILQVRAGGFIRNAAGAVLLCRRADVMLWDIPGGTIGLNEVPAHGLAREVREETGLAVRAQQLIGVYGGPEYGWTYPNGDQAQILTLFFAADILDGTLQPKGSENVNVAFFAQHELPPLLPRTRRMLQDAFAGRAEASFER